MNKRAVDGIVLARQVDDQWRGGGADDDHVDGQKRVTAMRFELIYREGDAVWSCGSQRRNSSAEREKIGAFADARFYCCSQGSSSSRCALVTRRPWSKLWVVESRYQPCSV